MMHSTQPSQKRPEKWQRDPPIEYADLDESLVSEDLLTAIRDAFRERKFPVYLFGDVGVGKSYAAALVFSRFRASRVMMTRFSEFMCDCTNAEVRGNVEWTSSTGQICEMTAKGWWKWLSDVDLLVIDEVGTGTSSQFRQEVLLRVFECRKSKPLLMTGNLTLTQITSEFTARIGSRLMEGTPIRVTGSDKRLNGLCDRVHEVKN